ncbi:GTP binding protein [Besnoitia besnoiti]|uniref:GTP binding protein n=1 Tax=Besnoitia besnoiti TaxID=94643 RepID=A0A2A9MI97_BESBE|nr:GTP binding protein [Besnoitia besnoiti]PFH35317.1 GTP binding protein [Besnoitia besnoiti]
MGGTDFIIGCVGKPSAGKSTFFNAATEGSNAKVGNFPFTTINPNEGIGFFLTDCPCTKNPDAACAPRYGRCLKGRRYVPVKLLDVAGLIPGAHQGRGLGNKFLDDLRHADVLMHVIDVSGTTNEKGETTIGYDASQDHAWLLEEMQLWIFNNLWSRWPSIARRQRATASSLLLTFSQQFSGYGAQQPLIESVLRTFDERQRKGPPLAAPAEPVRHGEDDWEPRNLGNDLTLWDKERVLELVKVFVELRFPFVLVLNKCDVGVDADRNVVKISEKFSQQPLVMCSALAECFLQKMKQQKYVLYEEGDSTFYTRADADDKFCMMDEGTREKARKLKPLDDKNAARLEKIKDMVIYRYGGTGVHEAIRAAVSRLGNRVPVYPVRSWHATGAKAANLYAECLLVPRNTSMREFAGMLHAAMERNFLYAEGPDGRRLKESDPLTEDNNVVRIVTDASGI